jgi:hypothetical protein
LTLAREAPGDADGPILAGFDPRYQWVDEVDVVHALEHVTTKLESGPNVAADGC